MNYMAEIKAFYDLVQAKQLSTGQIALWHALMHQNNKCAWIEWFTVPNITLELNSGLSRSGIYKARNVLKQYLAIDFKANGTRATSYKMVSLLNSKQVGEQDSKQVGNTLTKQDKTRQVVVDNPQTPFEKVVELFKESGMGELNQIIGNILEDITDNNPLELIEEAFKRSGANNATSVRYPEKMLLAWSKKGIKSLDELKTAEKNRSGGYGSTKNDSRRGSGEPDPYADIGITL